MTDPKPPKAPANLGAAGRTLWRSLTTVERAGVRIEYRPDELVTLTAAARTADTIADLEQIMTTTPLVVDGSRGQPIVHPAVVELRLQRAALTTLLRRLDLPDESSGWDDLTASQRARKAAHARWGA
jgi:hypothetical protein